MQQLLYYDSLIFATFSRYVNQIKCMSAGNQELKQQKKELAQLFYGIWKFDRNFTYKICKSIA